MDVFADDFLADPVMAATVHHVDAHSALGTPLLAGGPRQWAAPVQLLHGVLLRVGHGQVGGHQPRWQRRLRRPCDCCRRLSDVFNGSVVAPLRLLHMDAGLLAQPSSVASLFTAGTHHLVVGEGQESFDAPAIQYKYILRECTRTAFGCHRFHGSLFSYFVNISGGCWSLFDAHCDGNSNSIDSITLLRASQC